MKKNKNDIRGNIEFKEVQQMPGGILWIMTGIMFLVVIGLAVGAAAGDKKSKNDILLALAVVLPIHAIIIYIMNIVRFETIVTGEEIYYRWRPFFRKFSVISRGEIATVKVRNSPFLQYGYKRIPGWGTVHNLSRGKGLQFVLKSGKKYFIGSQKINGFQRAVEKLAGISMR
ncbi:MAG: hypothetical protein Q8941_16845 [Bacteroidota bacterium]|nr:hypothetical protein [Bacteroidota bacterium]